MKWFNDKSIHLLYIIDHWKLGNFLDCEYSEDEFFAESNNESDEVEVYAEVEEEDNDS